MDYIAPMAIVAASSVIGRQIAIRPKKNDSFEVVQIFGNVDRATKHTKVTRNQ